MILTLTSCGDSPKDDRQETDAGGADAGGADAALPSRDAGTCRSGRQRTFYWDADGDGYGVPGAQAIHACAEQVPAGYSSNAKDCDDSDPNRQRILYRDADQDGFGDSNMMSCTSAAAPGFAISGGDCDDDDPTRFPGAPEIWPDGLDQDCDGSDRLHGCIAAPDAPEHSYATTTVIPFPDLSGMIIEPSANCAGADLYFVLVGACPVCAGGKSTLVVGNRGTSPAAFVVKTEVDSLEVSTPLPALTFSQPLEVDIPSGTSSVEITLLGGAQDCDPTSNAHELGVEIVDCW